MTIKTTIDDRLLFDLVEESHLVKEGDLSIAELLWILKTPCPAFLLKRNVKDVVGVKIKGTDRILHFATVVNLSEDEMLDRGGVLYSLKIVGRREQGNIRLLEVQAHTHIPEPYGIHFLDAEVTQWYLQQRDIRASLQIYRIQPDDHIRECHRRLRDSLKSRTLIYIDTCHWVKMRHCILGDPQKSEVYQRILDRLTKLKQHGCILCPLSLPLVVELMRQTRENTFDATVRLMDELSEGICLQEHEFLLEMEIQRSLVKLMLGAEAPDLLEWTWTKVGWVAGEALEAPNNLTADQIQYLQGEFFNEVWEMTLRQAIENMRAIPLPATDSRIAAAEWYNAHASRIKELRLRFDDILKIQRKNVFAQSTFKKRFFESVNILGRRFPKQAREVMARPKPLIEVEPFLIPTLQICAGIQAAFISSGQKFDKNDFTDAQHAAVALPYVDAFFCDKSLKHKLTTSPLHFDKAYSTVVLADPDAILDYLLRIPTE